MHVDREKMSAKFWRDPDVALAENHGFNRKELRDIERMMRDKVEVLKNDWDRFCHADTKGLRNNKFTYHSNIPTFKPMT